MKKCSEGCSKSCSKSWRWTGDCQDSPAQSGGKARHRRKVWGLRDQLTLRGVEFIRWARQQDDRVVNRRRTTWGGLINTGFISLFHFFFNINLLVLAISVQRFGFSFPSPSYGVTNFFLFKSVKFHWVLMFIWKRSYSYLSAWKNFWRFSVEICDSFSSFTCMWGFRYFSQSVWILGNEESINVINKHFDVEWDVPTSN